MSEHLDVEVADTLKGSSKAIPVTPTVPDHISRLVRER